MTITLLITITVSIMALAITDIAVTLVDPTPARTGTAAAEVASTWEAKDFMEAEDSTVAEVEGFTVAVAAEEVTAKA